MKSLDQKREGEGGACKGDTREAIEKLKSFIHEVEALYKEDKEGNTRKKRKDTAILPQRRMPLNPIPFISLKVGREGRGKEHNKD